jgi:hypothetical protein
MNPELQAIRITIDGERHGVMKFRLIFGFRWLEWERLVGKFKGPDSEFKISRPNSFIIPDP